VGAVPRLCELHPDIRFTTEEKHGKTSVRVAARTSQADTVQYKNNEQYNAQKKKGNTRVVQRHRTLKNTEYTTQETKYTTEKTEKLIANSRDVGH
jgi:hypothetical protein